MLKFLGRRSAFHEEQNNAYFIDGNRMVLIDCAMEDADLAFEYSDVQAEVRGHILSVKNPRSGRIVADRPTRCTGPSVRASSRARESIRCAPRLVEISACSSSSTTARAVDSMARPFAVVSRM